MLSTYEKEQLIMQENQKLIQSRMDAQRQTKKDLIEGTKALAEKREADLQALKAKQEMYKEVAPVSEMDELHQLRERAKIEDAQKELAELRKRFAKDGE